MNTFTAKFTDVHGLSHDAAVVQIKRANCNNSNSIELNQDSDKTLQSHSNQSHYVNYEMQYWPSQRHKDDNNEPLVYVTNTNGYTSSDIHFESDTELKTQAQLESAVETHFRSLL
jgi:hypothetical protein